MQNNKFITTTATPFNTQKDYAIEVRNFPLRSDLPSKSLSIMSKPARRSDKENS